MSAPYLPPLDQLLALDLPEFGRYKTWPDYLSMGFTAEHAPELIRMVLDEELEEGDEDDPATYGAIHAWRTLGLLRADTAVEPLMRMLEMDSDWAKEEIPAVLGRIGPAAFEPLRAALAHWSREWEPWKAGAAGAGLVEIARRFPEMRDAAVSALTRQLRWWARHPRILNTMLIDDLVDLKAVESAAVIEEVFAAGAADTLFARDWEQTQVDLGLLPERVTPRPRYIPLTRLLHAPEIRIIPPDAAANAKRRRKAQKAARQRNRRRR